MPDATILDVIEGGLRVSCTVKTATLGKPKVTSAQTIQLIDLADVCAISVDGEA